MEIKQAIEILESRLHGKEMLSKEHFDALTLAVQALKRQRWIPCSEMLPEVGKEVLVYSEYGGVAVDYFDGALFGHTDITHWMPLPEPPEKGGNGQ